MHVLSTLIAAGAGGGFRKGSGVFQPCQRRISTVKSTACAGVVKEGGGAGESRVFTHMGRHALNARVLRAIPERAPPQMAEGRITAYHRDEELRHVGYNGQKEWNAGARRVPDMAPPNMAEGYCTQYGQGERGGWRGGNNEYVRTVRPSAYGRGPQAARGAMTKPRRSNWYSNSASFDRMLREATREHFDQCTRLKHLPPVSRRTLRRKERRMMVREAEVRFAWFRDGLHRIERYTPLLWYRGKPPMFDFIEMESLTGDPAFRNWEERVREFKFKVRCRWTRGQVDEIHKLKQIGMHHHAQFMSAIEGMAGRGEVGKAQDMVASAQVQARVVKEFMRTEEYKVVMSRLEYRTLFQNKGVRQATRSGDLFIWEIYEKVRIEMENEMGAGGMVANSPAINEEKKPSPPVV